MSTCDEEWKEQGFFLRAEQNRTESCLKYSFPQVALLLSLSGPLYPLGIPLSNFHCIPHLLLGTKGLG